MANDVNRFTRPTAVPLRSVMDQLFSESFFSPAEARDLRGDGAPAPINVLEASDSFIIQMALPGVEAESLNVQALGSDLRINGKYATRQPDNAVFLIQGLPSGDVKQTISLPSEVMGEGAEAMYRDGILVVTLPKAEHAKVRSIKVQTGP